MELFNMFLESNNLFVCLSNCEGTAVEVITNRFVGDLQITQRFNKEIPLFYELPDLGRRVGVSRLFFESRSEEEASERSLSLELDMSTSSSCEAASWVCSSEIVPRSLVETLARETLGSSSRRLSEEEWEEVDPDWVLVEFWRAGADMITDDRY